MASMISIIIPSYNRAAIIPATLDSILAQTYQDWECIVIDDLSKDDTKAVVQQYLEKDSRFRLLTNERKKGAQGARNTGILHAQSEWVICFDSDNTMHPDMLEKLSAAITDDVDVVQCFSALVDANTGKPLGQFQWVSEGDIHRKLFTQETYVDFNQSIVRKSKLMEIGLLDEDCPSMQEWDTHIRLSNIARYTTVREQLLDYYLNGADAITTDKRREVRGRMYILRKHLAEWREDTDSLHFFIEQIYRYIRMTASISYRLHAIRALIKVDSSAIGCLARFWPNRILRFVKRKLGV